MICFIRCDRYGRLYGIDDSACPRKACKPHGITGLLTGFTAYVFRNIRSLFSQALSNNSYSFDGGGFDAL